MCCWFSFLSEWPQFVTDRMARWGQLYMSWARDSTPLHVLVYSRLETRLEPELQAVFAFLNESSIAPRVDCAALHPEGLKHRDKPEWQQEAAVFSQEQRDGLNRAMDSVQTALEARTGRALDDFQLWKR